MPNHNAKEHAVDYNFPIMCSAFMERLPEWLTGIGTIGLSLVTLRLVSITRKSSADQLALAQREISARLGLLSAERIENALIPTVRATMRDIRTEPAGPKRFLFEQMLQNPCDALDGAAALVKRNLIDQDLAWDLFGDDLASAWRCCKKHVEWIRANEPVNTNLWPHWQWLAETFETRIPK